MKKQIFYVATMSLLLTGLNTVINSQKIQASNMFTVIGNSVQFPESKSYFARHTIRINIADNSEAISQLKIVIPEGLTIKNDITVRKESGEEVKIHTLINNNIITLDFPEPISDNTKLEIDLNQVIISGTTNQWLYRIYGKFVGIIPEIDLGVARIRIY